MSDDGNVNGEVLDTPLVNSEVVGVPYEAPGDQPDQPVEEEPVETQRPGNRPTPAAVEADVFDPEVHTIDDVKAYVEANPDALDAVYDAELAGKNRTTLVAWLEEERSD